MPFAPPVTGRPLRLYVLDYGLFRVHSGPRDVGIQGYLISTDADEHILIDTGFPQKYADDANAATAEDKLGSFGKVLECTNENMPAAQLARAGLDLEDITLMIQTHTHIDHVGHMDACPQAPILIAADERALARPLYWGKVQPMTWPDREYLLVEDDCEIGPGLQVLFVPGHAPGQIAIMVDLPDTGPVLLTSDAISRPTEFDDRFAGSWDAPLALYHAKRLIRLAEEQDAKVIYGHCPEQWKTLAKAPEFLS